MALRTMAAAMILAILLASFAQAADDVPDDLLLDLREGSTDESVHAALNRLRSAGEAAFPMLLKHIHDGEAASSRHFQRERVVIDHAKKTATLWHPTIGDVSFDLIQSRIEGNWPKSYQSLYVISKTNVAVWLSDHSGMTLRDLQLTAATEELENAEMRHQSTTSEWSRAALTFIQEHVERVRRGGEPDDE